MSIGAFGTIRPSDTSPEDVEIISEDKLWEMIGK